MAENSPCMLLQWIWPDLTCMMHDISTETIAVSAVCVCTLTVRVWSVLSLSRWTVYFLYPEESSSELLINELCCYEEALFIYFSDKSELVPKRRGEIHCVLHIAQQMFLLTVCVCVCVLCLWVLWSVITALLNHIGPNCRPVASLQSNESTLKWFIYSLYTMRNKLTYSHELCLHS